MCPPEFVEGPQMGPSIWGGLPPDGRPHLVTDGAFHLGRPHPSPDGGDGWRPSPDAVTIQFFCPVD